MFQGAGRGVAQRLKPAELLSTRITTAASQTSFDELRPGVTAPTLVYLFFPVSVRP
jgi:hypothetical protein